MALPGYSRPGSSFLCRFHLEAPQQAACDLRLVGAGMLRRDPPELLARERRVAPVAILRFVPATAAPEIPVSDRKKQPCFRGIRGSRKSPEKLLRVRSLRNERRVIVRLCVIEVVPKKLEHALRRVRPPWRRLQVTAIRFAVVKKAFVSRRPGDVHAECGRAPEREVEHRLLLPAVRCHFPAHEVRERTRL